jgi:hypothetical protein
MEDFYLDEEKFDFGHIEQCTDIEELQFIVRELVYAMRKTVGC